MIAQYRHRDHKFVPLSKKKKKKKKNLTDDIKSFAYNVITLQADPESQKID